MTWIITPMTKRAVEPIMVILRPYLLVNGYTKSAAMNDPSCSKPTVSDETLDWCLVV